MFGFQVEGPACKTLCLHQLVDPEASADLSSSLIGKLELKFLNTCGFGRALPKYLQLLGTCCKAVI